MLHTIGNNIPEMLKKNKKTNDKSSLGRAVIHAHTAGGTEEWC
jgi:hypothetical protein